MPSIATNASAPALLDRLREETRGIHLQLEQDLAITRPDLKLEQYVAMLQRFYGIYRPLETLIFSSLPSRLAPMLDKRRKLAALEQDLLHFEITPSLIPLAAHLPALLTTPALFGALYVVEGATLGGQIIARHLRGTLGLSAATGCCFFASYGENSASMWHSFRILLMAECPQAAASETVAAAQSTFAAMHGWLCAS